jgi:hypothetical protein
MERRKREDGDDGIYFRLEMIARSRQSLYYFEFTRGG